MPSTPKLSIIDGMFLVGATAFGLVLYRWTGPPNLKWPPDFREFLPIWCGPMACLAGAWGLAVLPMSLKPPRPRRLRLFRRPGFVACLATVGAVLITLGLDYGFERIKGPTVVSYSYFSTSMFEVVPATVLGSWLALRLSGRWSPSPTWPDRIGRALGFYWLSWYPATLLQLALTRFL